MLNVLTMLFIGVINFSIEDHHISHIITLQQFFPKYNILMSDSIDVKISYDNENLYISLHVFQDPKTIITKNALRDEGSDQDFCGFIIDPYGTKQEGYMFLFGAGGNLLDARILKSTGGYEDYSWDANVLYNTTITDSGYRIECQLPFNNFRISNDEQKWTINIYRQKISTNERGLLSLPPDFCANMMMWGGIEVELKDIKNVNLISVTPYGLWSREDGNSNSTEKGDAGFDIRIPISTSGIINCAFNPDFSQLEGDPLQFSFNTRYALFYNEYRPFFLEEKGLYETKDRIFVMLPINQAEILLEVA